MADYLNLNEVPASNKDEGRRRYALDKAIECDANDVLATAKSIDEFLKGEERTSAQERA